VRNKNLIFYLRQQHESLPKPKTPNSTPEPTSPLRQCQAVPLAIQFLFASRSSSWSRFPAFSHFFCDPSRAAPKTRPRRCRRLLTHIARRLAKWQICSACCLSQEAAMGRGGWGARGSGA